MNTLLTASSFFCAISLLFLFSQNMLKRRNKQVEQLITFIKQGQQLKNSTLSTEHYEQWVSTVNAYLNKHLNRNLQTRFNQIRTTRNTDENPDGKIIYELDGRLYRLTEFVIELKRIKFYEPEALGRYIA